MPLLLYVECQSSTLNSGNPLRTGRAVSKWIWVYGLRDPDVKWSRYSPNISYLRSKRNPTKSSMFLL